MTIEEIQSKKRLLEIEIKQLIDKFQAENHVLVEDIQLEMTAVGTIGAPHRKWLSHVEARILI